MKTIKNFGVDFEVNELENGVKLFSFYKPNAPISFRAYFYAGSQFDGDKPGLAHFCEHIWVGGTEKYPTKDILNDKIQEIGAKKNAFTSKKFMYLTMDIADKTDLPEMFDFVDQILNHSIFDSKIIENERGVVMAEQTRKKANPGQYINDLLSSLLFQNTTIENAPLGSEKTIKEATREDLFAYYDKYLKNGFVAYFLAGDFDKKWVVDALKKINRGRLPIPSSLSPLPIFTNKIKSIENVEKQSQNYLGLGVRLSPLEDNRERVIATLLSSALGGGNTSRLIKKLRSERGLVYDVSSNVFNSVESAYLNILTNCKAVNTNEVIKIINEEFAKIKEDGFEEKELELAKKGFVRNLKFNSEETAFWVNHPSMNNLTVNKNILLADEMVEIINSITAKEMSAFIDKYLKDKELLLAGFGDFKDI